MNAAGRHGIAIPCAAPGAQSCAAALGAVLAGVAPDAAATPGLAQPTFSVSGTYQSNGGYAVDERVPSDQASVALGLPLSWIDGRYEIGLSPSATLRRSRGVGASDDRDLGLGGALRRNGERLTLGATAGYNEVSLNGPDAPDLGPGRAEGSQRGTRAALEARWAATELSSLSLAATAQRTRYGAGAAPALRGSDDRVVSLSYARSLGPRLQLLGGVSRARYAAEDANSGTTATGIQGGFAVALADLWSASATYGRSRVARDDAAGTVPAAVYEASLTRRAESGTLSVGASQSLQSSAFGAVTRQRSYTAAWSQALSPRLAGGLQARRQDSADVFGGFDLQRLRTDEFSASVSYALTELWSLGIGTGWTRRSSLGTPSFPQTSSAASWSSSVSVSRRFGAWRLPEVFP